MTKALIQSITLTPSTCPLADVHSVEVLGAMDYFKAVGTAQLSEADMVIIPSQISIAEATAKGISALVIAKNLAIVARAEQKGLPIFYLQQDPRSRFMAILGETPVLSTAKLLTTYYGTGGLNCNFGRRGAKYQPYKNFMAKDNFSYDLAYAGFQMDEYRQHIFDKYASKLYSRGIGKTEPMITSLTGNKKVGTNAMIALMQLGAATILLYDQVHVDLGFFHTTRLFQGLSWGNYLLIPKEYRQVVAGMPCAKFCIVNDAKHAEELVSRYLADDSYRIAVMRAQMKTFNLLSL